MGPLVKLDLPQKLWQISLADSGVVRFERRLENIPRPDLCRGIPVCQSVCDCKAEDLVSRLESTLCDIPGTPRLDRLGHRYWVSRLDLANLQAAENRQDVRSQTPPG